MLCESEFLARMNERGITVSQMAQRLGICETDFKKCLENQQKFTVSQALAIQEILHFYNPNAIFFCTDVT